MAVRAWARWNGQNYSLGLAAPPPPTPDAPTGLAAAAGDQSVSLSWSPVPGATQYRVYRDGTLWSTASGTSVLDTGLTNGQTYQYRVSAIAGGVEGPQSAPAQATPFAPAPSDITHGSQIPATSDAAETFLQVATGALTEWPGEGSVTLSGTQVIENRSFTNRLIHIAAGANITLRNCRLQGPLGQTSYTIRSVTGGEARLNLERCLIIARTTTSSTPRALTFWNPTNIRAWRCVFRGGIDNVYANAPATAGVWSTGDAVVPNARVWFEECWFGDIQRVASSHSDGIQFDGGGFALIRRCRVMGYSMPVGSDPLVTRVTNPATATFASGPIIATQNSSNPSQLSRIVLRNTWIEGGNYTVDLAPTDGLPPNNMVVSGCLFGVRHNFGPLRLPAGSVNQNNRWGQSGTVTGGATVTAGELLSGSSA